MIVIGGIIFLGFCGFVIYFIFKQMQFVLVAVNLYKRMIDRQDDMIQLLKDIRDNTKIYDEQPSTKLNNNFGTNRDGIAEYSNLGAKELYDSAYHAFEIKDYAKAKLLNDLLLKKYPSSKEAQWALKHFNF